MSNIQIFNNPEFGEIRTIDQNGLFEVKEAKTTRPSGVACRRLSLPKAERRSGCCTCN